MVPMSCILVFLLLHQVLSASETNVNSKTSSSQIEETTQESFADRISEIKCKEYADKIKCTSPPDAVNSKNTYIEDARSVNFPHMVLLLQKLTDGKYLETCDGTLISSRFILTPAHCSETTTEANLVARLGDHITDFASFDGVNQIEIPIKYVYKHPSYTTPDRIHDIALLELAQDVSFTEYIRPACLGNGQQYSEQEATVTSCMTHSRYNLDVSKELQKFHMRITTNDECKLIHRGISATQVCAVHGSRLNDTHCLSHAGAPLQVMTTFNPCVSRVVGVASQGTTICGDLPAVFARVSNYLDWIQKIVWPRNV